MYALHHLYIASVIYISFDNNQKIYIHCCTHPTTNAVKLYKIVKLAVCELYVVIQLLFLHRNWIWIERYTVTKYVIESIAFVFLLVQLQYMVIWWLFQKRNWISIENRHSYWLCVFDSTAKSEIHFAGHLLDFQVFDVSATINNRKKPLTVYGTYT